LKITQQIIAGNDNNGGKSVKRTAEVFDRQTAVVRFTDLIIAATIPSNELLGYFHAVRFTDGKRPNPTASVADVAGYAGWN
jgi:hypothetical protein